MQALGIDLEFVPPGWCGAAMWLQAGLNSGWRPELVRLAVDRVRARKNYQLPFSYRYLSQPIAREHQLMAERSLPTPPISETSNQEANHAEKTPQYRHATPWQQSRDRWRAAAAKLNASVAADKAARAGEGDGGADVQPTATVGRDRS